LCGGSIVVASNTGGSRKYRRNMEVQEMEDGSNRKEEREEPHPLLW
jgi:hypothetical protein